MMKNDQRTPAHKRDDNLERILQLLNTSLEDDEHELTREFTKPQYPVLFIVGNARSGTTLLYQWLASTGLFSYPSNMISRFYGAPYIGALIHKMFVDYDKFGEILGDAKLTFDSRLGKTPGAVSPHEFWYFWRRFFKFGEIQKLSGDELAAVDAQTFVRELAALEGAFGKPLLLKGMILNWNLRYLKEIIPNALFLHIKRDDIYNMHSLFKARLKYFGDVTKWYSFKPPEYPALKGKPVYQQLAGQVLYTNRAIHRQLNGMNTTDYLRIDYRDLCSDPATLYHRLSTLLEYRNITVEEVYNGPEKFDNRNVLGSKDFSMRKAQAAIEDLN